KGETLTITFDDALADGLYERVRMAAEIKGRPMPSKAEWIADIRDTYGEDASEELDCIPKAGSGSWLDPAALAACEHPEAGDPALYSGGLVFIGRDVARRRDLSVVHAFELVGDVLWMRLRWAEKAATFQAQDDVFDDCFRRFRVVQAWIDQTGMGEKVVEDAQRRHGMYRVQGQLLTGPARLDLAIAIKERVEACKLRIPPIAALRTDYRAIKKQGGAAGAIRIVNEGEVHADEFWATALACRAAGMPISEYSYASVERGDPLGMPGPEGGEDVGGSDGFMNRSRRGGASGAASLRSQGGCW
ncbi:MAG: phage terminase large subunit family protein, partial [Caulobacteraceae bacterium]